MNNIEIFFIEAKEIPGRDLCKAKKEAFDLCLQYKTIVKLWFNDKIYIYNFNKIIGGEITPI